MQARVTRLDNGLTVATLAMGHVESVALGVWVGAGARCESENEHGIAHLLEHMAFKGTARRSARQIAEEIEAVGGDLNAATSVEHTAYYARVLRDAVPLALDIISDILTGSLFDAAELAREQHVIVQEIGAALDTPEDRVFDLLGEAAYPGQPIGRSILGTVETVRSFTADHLRAYLASNYRAPRMVVAAAGAVDHDAIVAEAQIRLGGVEAGEPLEPAPARFIGGDAREEGDLHEAQLTFAFPGRSHLDEDYYAAQVLASVLGGGMSSRLFQEVREKRGLCYSVEAFHWGFVDTGMLGIHAATGEGDLERLAHVIVDELDRASRDIEAAEIARAKAQMRAGLLMSLESPSAVAGRLARHILLYGRAIPLEETLARIDSVTVADVRRVAASAFAGKVAVAAVGPVARLPHAATVAAELARGVVGHS